MDGAHHLGKPVIVGPAGPDDASDWLAMRTALWPDEPPAALADEIAGWLKSPGDMVCFVARAGKSGAPLGFAEADLRHDYVNGCETSPVAFLEGIYVVPSARERGVARALVAAVEKWAQGRGCSELGSDALVDNKTSHAMHTALGFAETDRVVFFRKVLGKAGPK